MDNAHSVLIEQFEFDVGDKFTYEYNFYDGRLCDIRVEKIENSDPTLNNLNVLAAKGFITSIQCAMSLMSYSICRLSFKNYWLK